MMLFPQSLVEQYPYYTIIGDGGKERRLKTEQMTTEAHIWIRENINYGYMFCYIRDTELHSCHFEDELDATLFKLTWG